jgi:hypothetical protein
MACGVDTEANELIVSLIGDKSFDLPEINLDDPEYAIPTDGTDGIYAPVTRLTNDDLTTGCIDGSGTFDALMDGFKAHLKEEYDRNRITGAEYTKAYVALVQGAMSNATSYLLGRDAAYWQAVTAQLQARQARVLEVLARVQLQTAKVQMISLQYEALNQEANYALTKIKLSTESMAYCTAKYQLENMLPVQRDLLLEQIETQRVQTETGQYNLDNLLPKQVLLTQEQIEVQHAQTSDTRTDGLPVVGLLGKQKDLYSQQITSYMRDSEMKAAKLFTDAWITMKTIDEGLEPPVNFANTSLDAILGTVKTNNNIG